MDTCSGVRRNIDIHAREILEMRDRLNQILSLHTGRDLGVVKEDTERDNFMGGDQAVKYGIIDEVIENREG